MSEYNLTFESDSNDLELELTSNHDNSKMNKRIVMDLGHSGEVPSGYMEGKEGEGDAKSGRREGDGEETRRRVSYDQQITTLAGRGDDDAVVITQTVVTIG